MLISIYTSQIIEIYAPNKLANDIYKKITADANVSAIIFGYIRFYQKLKNCDHSFQVFALLTLKFSSDNLYFTVQGVPGFTVYFLAGVGGHLSLRIAALETA